MRSLHETREFQTEAALWLEFPASEGKPYAPMVFFRRSFPVLPRHSRFRGNDGCSQSLPPPGCAGGRPAHLLQVSGSRISCGVPVNGKVVSIVYRAPEDRNALENR